MRDRTVPAGAGQLVEVVAPRPPRGRRFPARLLATYAASVATALVIWQVLSLHTIKYFLPSPLDVLGAIGKLYRTGQLVQDVEISSFRILTGWGLGILAGVPLGLVMGWWPFTRRLFDPYVEFFRFIPPIAFVSLAIIWFGIGEVSKIILIFYTTVFIITLNTIAGVLAVEEVKLRAAASLGAGRLQMLLSVVFPATIPFVVTGARLAMGNSFLTIVSAEIVAAEHGVGALIWNARNYAATDQVFAGIIVLGMMGFVYDRIIRIAAARLLRRYAVRV